MTYIVNESCIRCKYTDCVEVCPVDCFYEARTSSSTSLAQHHEEEACTARADAFVNVPDKFAKYFSPNPGEGD